MLNLALFIVAIGLVVVAAVMTQAPILDALKIIGVFVLVVVGASALDGATRY